MKSTCRGKSVKYRARGAEGSPPKKKYNITEIPVVWYERVIGKSNFKMIEWVLPYLKWLIYAINTALSIK